MKPLPRHRLAPMVAAGLVGLALVAVSVVSLAQDHNTPTDFGSLPAANTATSAATARPQPSTADPSRAGTTTPVPITVSTPKPASLPARRTAARGTAAHGTAAHLLPAHPPRSSHQAAPAASGVEPDSRSNVDDANAGIPLLLELPTLGVRAAIQPVVTDQGALTVPEDPASVGWWAGSSLPGSVVGSTVLDGHIDSATRGTGAFWHLSTLTTGDHITITTATRQVGYQVVARRVYPKNAGVPADVFDRAGPPLLVLISCGGPFDADRGSYEDNIAVFAAPIR